MNITKKLERDEAQDILDALRKIQDTPELQAAAKTNPESVLNRLALSGVTRHAVAFAIAATVIVPATGQNFWN